MPCLEEGHLLYLLTIPYLLVHLLIVNHLLCMVSKDNKSAGVGFREAMRIICLDGWTIIRLLKVV